MNVPTITPARRANILTAPFGLACLLASAGCALGPVYHTPEPPRTTRYGPVPTPASVGSSDPRGGGIQRLHQGAHVPDAWWKTFGNTELDRRVQAALDHSPTLQAARASLRQSQEILKATRGAWFPSITAGAGVTRAQQSVDAGGTASPFTLYNASVNVSYTLDLFGGVRRRVELSQAQAEYQRWLTEGASLSLAANVTTATFQEASLQEQIQAAGQVVDLLQEQSTLTAKQVAIGSRSEADLLAVRAQLASAQASLPPLRLSLATVRNQLAVLLGRMPSQELAQGGTLASFQLPPDIPVTLPSDLVRQRPDVRAAEAQLWAATAQVGLATSNLFPRITLGGGYGSEAAKTGRLFEAATRSWDLGLNLFQPLFEGGSLRAQKRAAEAGLDAASAIYRASVLNAFQNVSDALDALQYDADALAAQARAESAAARSLKLVKAQYALGAVSYLQLLDATRQWQLARLGEIRARAARLSDTAALYAALGGGWHSPATRP